MHPLTILVAMLTAFGLLLVGLALFTLVSLLLAWLRNPLADVIFHSGELLAKPAVVPGLFLLRAIEYLPEHLADTQDGLHYNSEHNHHNLSEWAGWDIVVPLVYLALAVVLAYGDFYLFALRFAALFHVIASKLPIALDLQTGIIWLATIALWGSVMFDLAGVTPVARPFHNFHPRTRRFLLVVSAIMLVLSVLAGLVFWLWGQFIIDSISAPWLEWLFIGVFALLLNAAVGVAGWAVIASFGSFYALLLILALLCCRGGVFVCSLVVRVIDAVAAVITSLIDIAAAFGKRIWDWLCTFPFAYRLNLQPLDPFTKRQVIGRELLLALSAASAPAGAAQPNKNDDSEEMEVKSMYYMAPNQRIANIVGFGSLARMLLPLLWHELERQRATSLLRTFGLLDINHVSHDGVARYDRDGVIDISPTPDDIDKAIARPGGFQAAEQQLSEQLAEKLVDACQRQRSSQEHILLVQTLPGTSEMFENWLRGLKRRQSQQHMSMFSMLPHLDQRDTILIADYQRLLRLHNDGVVEATFLLDKHSNYARLCGEEGQEQAAALAISSLLIAHMQNGRNATPAEVIQRLGRQAAFLGMAFRRIGFAGGQQVVRQRGARKNGPSGSSWISDAIAQAKVATDDVLHTPEAQGIEATIDTSKPFFLIYSVPIAAHDTNWNDFTSELATWLKCLLPMALPIFASVSGTKTGQGNTIQVTAIFPLPDIPAPLAPLMSSANKPQSLPTP